MGATIYFIDRLTLFSWLQSVWPVLFWNRLNRRQIKNNDFLSFLIKAKKNGLSVVGYGAAAKGNTLMNFSGVRPDLLPYVVDKSDAKQDKFMPGSRVPIMSETQLKKDKPDYIVIFPWNIQDEIIEQLAYIREWGGKFVIFIPSMRVI